MHSFPKNILLIVDFKSERKISIQKVAGLINRRLCTVHLLCILNSWRSFAGFEIKPPFKGILKSDIETYVNKITQLQDWKQEIEVSCPGADVKMHIQKGFWMIGTIVRAVNKINPDLVIVNRGRRNTLFPFIRSFSPNRLAKSLSCRIITVNAGSGSDNINSPGKRQKLSVQNEN